MASGGDCPNVRDILQEVRKLGRLPRRRNNPLSEAEVAETKLRKRIDNRKLLQRVQQEIDALTERADAGCGGTRTAPHVQVLRRNVACLTAGTMPPPLGQNSVLDASRRVRRLQISRGRYVEVVATF